MKLCHHTTPHHTTPHHATPPRVERMATCPATHHTFRHISSRRITSRVVRSRSNVASNRTTQANAYCTQLTHLHTRTPCAGPKTVHLHAHKTDSDSLLDTRGNSMPPAPFSARIWTSVVTAHSTVSTLHHRNNTSRKTSDQHEKGKRTKQAHLVLLGQAVLAPRVSGVFRARNQRWADASARVAPRVANDGG